MRNAADTPRIDGITIRPDGAKLAVTTTTTTTNMWEQMWCGLESKRSAVKHSNPPVRRPWAK